MMVSARAMSMLSEGLVIRSAGTRPRAPVIHYQSWNIQSRAHYLLSGYCWVLARYLVIGAVGTLGGMGWGKL